MTVNFDGLVDLVPITVNGTVEMSLTAIGEPSSPGSCFWIWDGITFAGDVTYFSTAANHKPDLGAAPPDLDHLSYGRALFSCSGVVAGQGVFTAEFGILVIDSDAGGQFPVVVSFSLNTCNFGFSITSGNFNVFSVS